MRSITWSRWASSWNRVAPNTLPAMAKTAANYASSALIKMEALMDGYAEGIALDTQGYVSEGSGQNVFVVRDRTLYTAPLSAGILPGITRDSVKAGMEINYLPSMPSAASIYDKPLK